MDQSELALPRLLAGSRCSELVLFLQSDLLGCHFLFVNFFFLGLPAPLLPFLLPHSTPIPTETGSGAGSLPSAATFKVPLGTCTSRSF